MPLSRDVLSSLGERLHEHAGLDLPAWVVEARALTRMGTLGLSATAYLDLVNSPGGEGELGSLVEAVRVGETSFFRHRPQVDALIDVVVPALRDRGCLSPRVWSAGCATGEEPYTIALVLSRALPRPTFSPSILATDVSADALLVAEEARYPKAVLADVPAEHHGSFSVEEEAVCVRPEIRSLVRFRRQNLADPDTPRGFEVVFCRNVLIYFGPEAKRRVLGRLVSALVPGGFLFLGYSETLRDVDGLQAVRYGDQVLWQKPVSAAAQPREGGEGAPSGRVRSSIPASAQIVSARAPQAFVSAPSSRAPILKAPVAVGTAVLAKVPVAKDTAALAKVPVSRDVGVLAKVPVSRDVGVLAKVPVSRDAAALAKGDVGREVVVRVTDPEAKELVSEIRAALAAPSVRAVVIDLDGAAILEDGAAPVIRRALAAGEASSARVSLRASRPGTQRWLRRNGFGGGES